MLWDSAYGGTQLQPDSNRNLVDTPFEYNYDRTVWCSLGPSGAYPTLVPLVFAAEGPNAGRAEKTVVAQEANRITRQRVTLPAEANNRTIASHWRFSLARAQGEEVVLIQRVKVKVMLLQPQSNFSTPYQTSYFEVIGNIPAQGTQIPSQQIDDNWFVPPQAAAIGQGMTPFGNIRFSVAIQNPRSEMSGQIRAFRLTPKVRKALEAFDTPNANNPRSYAWYHVGPENSPVSVTPGLLRSSRTFPLWNSDQWVASECDATGRFCFHEEKVSSRNGVFTRVGGQDIPVQPGNLWFPTRGNP